MLAAAVVIGVVLLNAVDNTPSDTVVSTHTTKPDKVTTSTGVTTTVVTLPVRAPADVKVLSTNGTDVKGVARKVTDQLKAAGYNVLAPTDAQKATVSAVFYVGDFMREAEAVAVNLGLPPETVQAIPAPAPVADIRGAEVLVVIGPELAERLGPITTTTTAKASTSSTTAKASTSSTTAKAAATTTTTAKP